MNDAERQAQDLWVWSQMIEAVRALDAVEGSLAPDEDVVAQRLLREADALRYAVEQRILGPLGITPRPPIA